MVENLLLENFIYPCIQSELQNSATKIPPLKFGFWARPICRLYPSTNFLCPHIPYHGQPFSRGSSGLRGPFFSKFLSLKNTDLEGYIPLLLLNIIVH